MTAPKANLNPAIAQFRRDLEARRITSERLRQLEVFRNGHKASPEDRQAADELLAECERLGEEEIGRAHRQDLHRPIQASVRTAGRNDRHMSKTHRSKDSGVPLTRTDTNNAGAADPRCLGEPFHNPYTFIPFPPRDWFTGCRKRRRPTPLSSDEVELDRLTGILEIELETLSPLMSCHPEPISNHGDHLTYGALKIETDVIVPATGVRGSLRSLMTILAGGTLSYVDDTAWLVQARDLSLGPAGKGSPPTMPENPFLARVVDPGTAASSLVLELGDPGAPGGGTRLVKAKKLMELWQSGNPGPLPRPKADQPITHLWIDDGNCSISLHWTPMHRWQVKLSGEPIGGQAMAVKKSEGAFLGGGARIEIPSELRDAYQGRNRHGVRRSLQTNDLVWLEPRNPNVTRIQSADEIASIQWARWGRRGERLIDVVKRHHSHLIPDALNPDGLVDEVTDLFGQVPMNGLKGPAGPFAARIRPENVVFRDSVGALVRTRLAPLQPPHPGCAAFYRDTDDADMVQNKDLPLRGYKVYRNTVLGGHLAPWEYGTQGVYDVDGRLNQEPQKVNKTCDLLGEKRRGCVRITFRSLSTRELALLLLACSVDWRLGGGKPLGLGRCRPTSVRAHFEDGSVEELMTRNADGPAALPPAYAGLIAPEEIRRRQLWHQSQLPVTKLRYPRAVEENERRTQRGGHVWFQRHVRPKKNAQNDAPPVGLEVLWVEGQLRQQAGDNDRVRAQLLPRLDPTTPEADVLFGYDLLEGKGPDWSEVKDGRRHLKKLMPFDSPDSANGVSGVLPARPAPRQDFDVQSATATTSDIRSTERAIHPNEEPEPRPRR